MLQVMRSCILLSSLSLCPRADPVEAVVCLPPQHKASLSLCWSHVSSVCVTTRASSLETVPRDAWSPGTSVSLNFNVSSVRREAF